MNRNNAELLAAISDMLDEKLETKLEEKLEQKLEEKLEKKLDEKLEKKLDEKFDRKFDQKFDDRLDRKFEEKLAPITGRLDKLETKVHRMSEDINYRLTKLEITQENEILPRLKNIESCYLSTYDRYRKGVDEHEEMKQDIAVLKKVTADHSRLLQQMA